MVVGLGLDGDGVESGRGCFGEPEAGAGGDEVEDLDDLGAEAAGELAVPAERVLAGDPALLVRGGAERKVGVAEQPVMGHYAVSGGEHAREAGAHVPVYGDGSLYAQCRARRGGQVGVREDADDHEHHVSRLADGLAACGRLDRAALPVPARLIGGRRCRADLHALAGQLGVHQRTKFVVNRGQYFGELFDLGDGEAAGRECFGHFQADVPGADDDGAGGLAVFEGAHDGEGVAHRVQLVDAVGGTELVQAADRGPDRDGAGADHELVVADLFFGAAGPGDLTVRPATSMRRAVVSGRRVIPAASRSAMVRWARLRQWLTSPET